MEYFYEKPLQCSPNRIKIHFSNGHVIVRLTYNSDSTSRNLFNYKSLNIQDLRDDATIISLLQERADGNKEKIMSHTIRMKFNKREVEVEYGKDGVIVPPSDGFNMLEVMKMRTNLLIMKKEALSD